jgi:hypothetical protein
MEKAVFTGMTILRPIIGVLVALLLAAFAPPALAGTPINATAYVPLGG